MNLKDRFEGAIFGLAIGASSALDTVFDDVPRGTERVELARDAIPIADLLPADLGRWFAYVGSLTTPPFTEQVQWVVLERPIEVREADIVAMRELFGTNARPIQPTHSRPVHSPG